MIYVIYLERVAPAVVNTIRNYMNFDIEFANKKQLSEIFDAQQLVEREVFFWLRNN